MKTTILCFGLLATSISYASTLQDELKPNSVPKSLICTSHAKIDTDKEFHDMHDIVTIIDYGDRYYIISDPSVRDVPILTPKLTFSDKDNVPLGAAKINDQVFVKGLGGNANNYFMVNPDLKSTIKFMCQRSFL